MQHGQKQLRHISAAKRIIPRWAFVEASANLRSDEDY
jgi:hypothetical protein